VIQTLKLRIAPIRPYLDYALWLNNLLTTELAFFALQWFTCFVLVWCGIQFSIQFAQASCALVASNGWLILGVTSMAAFTLWIFDCAGRMRRGTYRREESSNGSPS
jgi:hypothetical protein